MFPEAGLRICPALAFFGSQVGQSHRVLLPLGMAVDHRIIQDGGIDPDRRTRQHREVDRVTRASVDLDGSARRLDDRHGIEDAFRQGITAKSGCAAGRRRAIVTAC